VQDFNFVFSVPNVHRNLRRAKANTAGVSSLTHHTHRSKEDQQHQQQRAVPSCFASTRRDHYLREFSDGVRIPADHWLFELIMTL